MIWVTWAISMGAFDQQRRPWDGWGLVVRARGVLARETKTRVARGSKAQLNCFLGQHSLPCGRKAGLVVEM